MEDFDPKVRKLQDERMKWIGWICSQWSHFEYILFNAIRKMLQIDDEEVAKILIGGLDMRPRLTMASELAKHLKQPVALRKALATASAAIDGGLLKRRNRAIHGVHFLYADGELRVEIHRGRDRSRKRLSMQDLHCLCTDINLTAVALNAVVNRVLFGKETRPFALLEKPSPPPRKPKPPKQGQKPKPQPRQQRSSRAKSEPQ